MKNDKLPTAKDEMCFQIKGSLKTDIRFLKVP
ncbi:hypothetical protein BDE27_2242 [Xenorhabdus ehlersii]|uniref:Uncharacterized protein n=1 Tax=Xenorhabdus ehlersii TaxID=290111 RepID=A0A2D0IY26_9GAMM|nr:hypothetical protein [Xenorhabdus sp. TS4]MBC8948735.1 hypothetical protein [Xenorhabdus sp. TS4]PHM25251.1 hypothetical protein Xehl_01463 [Xenorhabdus ehlersii]PHM26828.1 hypothetical protein Xehl_00521 [Xenorhabdus ehlersii]RKE90382.1 hypothetical protein BDE27_2242 [Xenorhabdus ehlersii]